MSPLARPTLRAGAVTALALLGGAAAARFSARHAAAAAPGPAAAPAAPALATALPPRGPVATSALATAAASGVHPRETAPGTVEVSGAAVASATGAARAAVRRAQRRSAASLAKRAGLLMLGLGARNPQDYGYLLPIRGSAFVPTQGLVSLGLGRPPPPPALGVAGLEDGEGRPLLRPEWRTELRSDDGLVTLPALGERGYTDVQVPPEWAEKLVPHSLRRVVGQPPQQHEVYQGRLWADPSFTVAFKVMPTGSPGTRREIAVWERLSAMSAAGEVSMGNIAPLLDLQVFSDSTFMLYPAGSGTLRELFDIERGETVADIMAEVGPLSDPPDAGKAILPPGQGLPLMIDVLRGVQNLEAAGIVHAGFSENSILLIDGRAYISDLGTSCFEHDGDPELRCASAKDEEGSFVGSAFRHAPEMPNTGIPTGTSNTDWAFGLVLAEGLLGYPPTEVEDFERARTLDLTALGRRTLRWSIAAGFRIEEAAGFKTLAPRAQELLAGLLDHNPRLRMRPAAALQHLTATARSLGIRIPGEPKPIGLPSAWWSGWFRGAAWQ